MKTIEFCIKCGVCIPPNIESEALCISCRYHDPPKALPWDHEIGARNHAEPSFDPKEERHGDEEHRSELARESFRKLLEFLWRKPRSGKSFQQRCTAAARRIIVASAAVNVNLVDGATYRRLAMESGMTKQAASKILKEFNDLWGIHVRQRSSTAINNMRAARRRR